MLPREDFKNKQHIITAIRRSGRIVHVSLVPLDTDADWARADPAILDPTLYDEVPISDNFFPEKSDCVAVLEFRTTHYSDLYTTTHSGETIRWFSFARGKVRWVGGGNKFRGPQGCFAILQDAPDEFLTMVRPDSSDISDALAGRVRAFRFPFNYLSQPKEGIIERSADDPKAIIEEFFRFRVFVC